MSSDRVNVVLGAGPVGRAVVERLRARDLKVRVVTRSGQARVPAVVEVRQSDAADPGLLTRVCDGASVVYGCVGLDDRRWHERWPPVMEGMLSGVAAVGARFVFMDNLYMYGPTTTAVSEELPLTSYGRKPATRARITRMWRAAHESGRLQVVAVRASDFYGPGVARSAFGEPSFGRIIQARAAQCQGDIDQIHSLSYVPDVARALVTLGEADDDAMGQAWHVPNAPDRTVRELLQLFADVAGQTLTVAVKPRLALTLGALVNAAIREEKEMSYLWDRPFRVDASKFAWRFWSDATAFEDGMRATAEWYRRQSS